MIPELYTAWYALSIFCTFLGATVTCIGYTVLRYGHGNILCIYDFESVNDYNKHFQWRRAGRLIILCGWCLQGVALSMVTAVLVTATTAFAMIVNWVVSTAKCRFCFLKEDFRNTRSQISCMIPTHLLFAALMITGTSSLIAGNVVLFPQMIHKTTNALHNSTTIWQNSTRSDFREDFDTIAIPHINEWQLLVMTAFTSCFGFLINMIIDHHDERSEHYEKTYRMNQCDPTEEEQLLEFFREIDAAANSSYGAGGFCWRYRSELQAISGGAWSNLMYAYTKCVFLMLSGEIPIELPLFYGYVFAASVSAAIVLWIIQKAMSGEQGNAVVLLVLNANQALFGCYSTLFVFEESTLTNANNIAFWMVGIVFIIAGICTAFFVMDAARSYVPVNRKESEIAMKELCSSFDLDMADGDLSIQRRMKEQNAKTDEREEAVSSNVENDEAALALSMRDSIIEEMCNNTENDSETEESKEIEEDHARQEESKD